VKKLILPAVAALGFSAGALQAATFQVDYQNASNPFGPDGLYKAVTIDSAIYDGTYYAGGFNMTSAAMGDFLAFCVEVTQALRNGETYEKVATPFTEAVLDNISGLFNTAYEMVVDDTTAAGFQVALWEIVEDTSNGLDLSAGTFSATDPTWATGGSVVMTAQDFLDSINEPHTNMFEIDIIQSAESQDLVTARRLATPAPSAVPIPASGLLLLSAGGLLMARRRKG